MRMDEAALGEPAAHPHHLLQCDSTERDCEMMNNPMPAPRTAAPSLALFGVEPFRAALEHEALTEGDGHPVIIVPGRASDERSLEPLRNCCEALGYAVYDWEQGFNLGPQDDVHAWLHNLAEHVGGVASLHNRRVSLIGCHVGGVYARGVARLKATLVRRVLALGHRRVDDALAALRGEPVDVPVDDIHGLPWSPQVLRAVAERLAQPEGA
jgi:hypothetical protein